MRHHPHHRTLHLARSAVATAALLALAPAHAVNFVWNSGNFTPGVTAPSPLLAADTLAINSGGNKFMSAVTFDVQGTVNWNADSLFFQNGGVVNNAGLWQALGNDTIANNGGVTSAFNNSGIFRKTGGASTGTTTIGSIAFTNSGVIDTQTGTLALNGGNVTINAGSSFTGAGQTVIGNNATFNGGFTSANLQLAGGGFSGNSAVMTGSLGYSGGLLSGGWKVAAGQTLNGLSGVNKFITAGTLTNLGTVAWQTTDSWFLQNGAAFDNQGLFTVSASTTIVNNGGVQPTWTNAGTTRVTAGSTVTVGSVQFINSGGTLQADGTLQFTGADNSFGTGTVFSGIGTNLVSNNASFVGNISSQNLKLAGGGFTGGTGAVGSKAVLSGSAAFTGGTFSGAWQLAAGQSITANDGGNKFFSTVAFDNQGSFNWNTTDAIFMQNAAVFDNRGSFNVSQSVSLLNNGGVLPAFNNHGLLRVAAGKTLTVGTAAFVNKSGGVVQADGTVAFNGGIATFEANTVFSGTGVVNVNSNASFNGAYSGARVFINGGTASGTSAVVQGTTTLSGGVLSGTWQVAAGQTLAGASGGNKFLNAVTLDNLGTFAWNTTDALFLQNGAVLDNRGSFVANQSMALLNNGGVTSAINNYGVLRVVTGETLTVGTVAFTNKAGGTVDAQGSVNFSGSNAVFEGGTIFSGAGRANINTSASFAGSYSGNNVYINGGTASGSAAVVNGRTTFTGGTLAGSWAVPAGQQLVLASGANKFATTLTLANAGTLAVQTTDTLFFQSGTQISNTGLVDLQTDGAWVNNGGAASTITNQGRIQKSGGVGTSSISDALGFSNPGVVDVKTGTIALPSNFANAGTLMGAGTFAVAGTLTNNGHVAPGESPGTLSVSGNFAQGAGGSFDVELGGAAGADLLLVSGTASLAGKLALSCFGACSYAVGTSIVILDSVGDLSGSFSSMSLTGFATGAFTVVYDTVADRVLLQVTQTVTAAVPEPASWMLLLGGLAAVGLRRKVACRM